ncbi:hypothetical protein EIQ27_01995 [Xanthomonas campestris pv. armoraciae]
MQWRRQRKAGSVAEAVSAARTGALGESGMGNREWGIGNGESGIKAGRLAALLLRFPILDSRFTAPTAGCT